MRNITKKVIHNNWFFVASLIFLSWFVASDNLGKSIGSVYPVVEPLVIESAVAYDENATKIVGSTVKNFNCDFVEMDWYVEEYGVKGAAPSYFLDAPEGRPSGEIQFTGIIVGMTPERLDVAHSTVTHSCSFGIEVISDWYNGSNQSI